MEVVISSRQLKEALEAKLDIATGATIKTEALTLVENTFVYRCRITDAFGNVELKVGSATLSYKTDKEGSGFKITINVEV